MRTATGHKAEPAQLDNLVGRDEERLRCGTAYRFGSSEMQFLEMLIWVSAMSAPRKRLVAATSPLRTSGSLL
jgi:hypothetical protein